MENGRKTGTAAKEQKGGKGCRRRTICWLLFPPDQTDKHAQIESRPSGLPDVPIVGSVRMFGVLISIPTYAISSTLLYSLLVTSSPLTTYHKV